MTEGAWLYILRCADGSYYVGTTRSSLESRIAQHNTGAFGGYTATRRPVELIFSQWFDQVTDAIENERKLKNGAAPRRRYSFAVISCRYSNSPNGSHAVLRDARLRRAPQDEERSGLARPPPAL
jgi:putative endonuclease